MKMQVDFYSKDEVSIQMEFEAQNPEGKISELFMFACFTLRQFRNLGHNLASDSCAGLFLAKKDNPSLFDHWDAVDDGQLQRPTAAWGLAHVIYHQLISAGVVDSEAELKSVKAWFEYKWDQKVNFVDEELLGKLPTLVKLKGSSSKQFAATWLPFHFQTKGFGFLGVKVNYFACHSIIASYRFLSQKHSDDRIYLSNLYNTAKSCSSAHILNKIPLDQPVLATNILSRLGIIKK